MDGHVIATAPLLDALKVDYDVLDIDDLRFEDSCSQLKLIVQDLECRLASIIAQVLAVIVVCAAVGLRSSTSVKHCGHPCFSWTVYILNAGI